MRRLVIALALSLVPVHAAFAQPASSRAPEPALRRWFEFDQFVLSTRYRYIRSSADVVTSDQMQYREQIRARLNLDPEKRYTIHTGLFSGSSFISSWDNLGPGTGDFDGKHHYMKQLYFEAAPGGGVDVQAGGLFFNRGEHTEFTTYDEDGFLIGGRLSVRRPQDLFVDELSVTHGTLGPASEPNVWKRWDELDDTNYTQVLGAKRVSQMVATSFDYTRYAGSDTWRGAVALRFGGGAPLTGVRYEQYVRTSDPDEARAGFALTLERALPRGVRLQGGYATIDEHYGGLNADRIQRGRHFYAMANVPIVGPLSASLFLTHALDADYSISNKTRFDAVLAWDIRDTLRQTGIF